MLRIGLGLATLLWVAAALGPAAADPVKIRIGHGPSAEDNLWLMKTRPDLSPNQGSAYALDFALFRGSEPPDSPDFYRDPAAAIDPNILARQQAVLLQHHFQENAVDLTHIVDRTLAP